MFKKILALGVVLAAAAVAQTTGTITINGTIPQAVSITTAAGAALSSTVSLGALTAANSSTLATVGPIDVYIRSNQQYKLNAIATFTNAGAGADDGGSPIAASDIGFGITAKDAAGAHVASGHTDTITTKFDYTTTAMTALPVTNGMTPFVAGTNGTISDLAASTQIAQGSRVSAKGNIQTTTNYLHFAIGAATLPQYFSPTTGFQSVVTLTVITF